MTDFTCPRCHWHFKTKQQLSRHLQKHKPCQTTYTNKTREECLKQLHHKKTTVINSNNTTKSHNPTNSNNTTITTTTTNSHNTNNITIQINPFGGESLEHLKHDLIRLLETGLWVERFTAIRSVPENKNVEKVDDSNINMFRYNLKTGIPEWRNCNLYKAIDDIVKNDIHLFYEEVLERYRKGDETIKTFPMINAILNCAYVVQRFSLEELLDKNEKGHLDLHSFLIAMEKQKKPI